MTYTLADRKRIITEIAVKPGIRQYSFNGLKMYLDTSTLVPHPDTLTMIDLAADLITLYPEIQTIADVGTGSGIMAVALAGRFPLNGFIASDISGQALAVARKNLDCYRIANLDLRQNMDHIWLSEYGTMKIDLIISNPPFVGETEYASPVFLARFPEVLFEPPHAIVTRKSNSGFDPYLKMLANSVKNGTRYYLFQINSETVKHLVTEINKYFGDDYKIIRFKDLNDRFLLLVKN